MAGSFEDYLMREVVKYANSKIGRETIKKDNGVDLGKQVLTLPGESGKAMSRREYLRYGKEMKQILYEYTSPLIKSITLDDIEVKAGTLKSGQEAAVIVSFRPGSLHRDSLYDEEDTKYVEGLENIVLLFAKGYHAKDYVYGHWNYGGKGNAHGSERKSIRSRKDRSGNDFLIRAVDAFNAQHEAEGVAHAELLGRYKEDSENPVN